MAARTAMTSFLERYGAALFLGMPCVSYCAAAAFVYRPAHRYGMVLMLVCYAGALVGQWLDTKGI